MFKWIKCIPRKKENPIVFMFEFNILDTAVA